MRIVDGATEASPNTQTEPGSATHARNEPDESTKTMSEPVTIWTCAIDEDGAVSYWCPPRRADALSEGDADWLRYDKHLSDAELTAEYWAAMAARNEADSNYLSPYTPEKERPSARTAYHLAAFTAKTLRRFATHDQAV